MVPPWLSVTTTATTRIKRAIRLASMDAASRWRRRSASPTMRLVSGGRTSRFPRVSCQLFHTWWPPRKPPANVASKRTPSARIPARIAVVRGAATRRSAGIAWVIRWSPSRGPRTRGRSSRATDCPIERLDRAPGNGHDRTPADTAHRPGAGRTQLGDLLGPGLLPRTDPPGDHGSGAHRERGIPVPACGYDATLPFREVREVGQVCEDVLGTTGYLDALYDGAISPPLIIVCCDRPHPSSSSARSSRDRRSGSARMSISTIFPRVTVKPRTDTGRPPGAATTPAAPFTSAGRANGPSRRA